MSVDGSGHPSFVAAHASRPREARRPLQTLDVMGPARVAIAVRSLFLVGFDTNEIATLLMRPEPDIVTLLHSAPWPGKIEVRDV